MKIPILGWTVDERFLIHRQRSTSLAGIAGLLVAATLFFYRLSVHDTIEWDLFAIIMTIALVKGAAVAWYRLTD